MGGREKGRGGLVRVFGIFDDPRATQQDARRNLRIPAWISQLEKQTRCFPSSSSWVVPLGLLLLLVVLPFPTSSGRWCHSLFSEMKFKRQKDSKYIEEDYKSSEEKQRKAKWWSLLLLLLGRAAFLSLSFFRMVVLSHLEWRCLLLQHLCGTVISSSPLVCLAKKANKTNTNNKSFQKNGLKFQLQLEKIR